MISSIVLKDRFKIGMNSSKRFGFNDTVFSVEKDVPFVRYRFEQFIESDIEYIKSMMEQFHFSTHLAEFNLSETVGSQYNLICSNFDNIVKYLYIDITEPEVLSKQLSQEKMSYIMNIANLKFDRIMIRDKSTSLDMVTFKTVVRTLDTIFHIKEENYGVCSSPLSFGELACLTAVKARELMSTYTGVTDMSLPTANHECMNCCGCIRYMVIDRDVEAIPDSKSEGSKKEKANTEKAEKEPKEPKEKKAPKPQKPSIIPGMFNL